MGRAATGDARAEGADVPEVGAHPVGQRAGVGLVPGQLRTVVIGRRDAGGVTSVLVHLVQHGAFSDVDATAGRAGLGLGDEVADLVLTLVLILLLVLTLAMFLYTKISEIRARRIQLRAINEAGPY